MIFLKIFCKSGSRSLQTGLMTWTYSAMHLFWLDSKRLMPNSSKTASKSVNSRLRNYLLHLNADVYWLY